MRLQIHWGPLITVPKKFKDDRPLKTRSFSVDSRYLPEVENHLESKGLHVKRAAFGQGCGYSLVINPPVISKLPKIYETRE